MSVHDVLVDWATYGSVTKVLFMQINEPHRLADVIANIGPFPANNPARWRNWLDASSFLLDLENAVQVTDAALRQENAFIAATNQIAATVRLPAPTNAQIQGMVEKLRVVNDGIRQDQRFAAALDIGVALAGQIQGQLAKA
jgi:hypothetical protein